MLPSHVDPSVRQRSQRVALGTVMGFTAEPLHHRLAARFRGRRRLASAVTTLLGGVAMGGGGALVVWVVAQQIVAAARLVQSLLAGGPTLLGPRSMRLLAALGVPRETIVA